MSRHSSVLPLCPIRHDTRHTARLRCNHRIPELWAIVARKCFPRTLFWRTPNVPPSAIHRTWAIISRCPSHACSAAWNESHHSANIFHLNSTRTTFQCTSETPHEPSNVIISIGCGTTQNRCCRDCRFAPSSRHFLQQIQCRWWEQWYIQHGRCQMRSPNQPEGNWILLEAICKKEVEAQLQYLKQVEDDSSG